MTTVRVSVQDDRALLSAPYHPSLPPKAKSIGGRWDSASRVWTFDARDADRVRELARAIYGTDGSSTRTVTVRVQLDSRIHDGQTIYLFGREIASRRTRDERVRLGDGVIVVEGQFPRSGGTMRYPAVFGHGADPVTVEIRDVPADLVTDDVQVVDPATDRRAALDAEIAALEARLAALRAEREAL